jgi:hypothetical protein
VNAFYLLGTGKPRGRSNSESLARYLHARLAPRGAGFAAIDARSTLHSAVELQRLLDGVAGCDLFVLASPIYVDALPYPVVHALEAVVRARAGATSRCRFAALLNCGFPEAWHCELGIEMARVFARAASLEWSGGLGLGGGEALAGRPLERAGGAGRHARQALDMTAQALARGESIPDAAVRLMASPPIPDFLYRMIGTLGWKRRARQHGAADLRARPLAKR